MKFCRVLLPFLMFCKQFFRFPKTTPRWWLADLPPARFPEWDDYAAPYRPAQAREGPVAAAVPPRCAAAAQAVSLIRQT